MANIQGASYLKDGQTNGHTHSPNNKNKKNKYLVFDRKYGLFSFIVVVLRVYCLGNVWNVGMRPPQNHDDDELRKLYCVLYMEYMV